MYLHMAPYCSPSLPRGWAGCRAPDPSPPLSLSATRPHPEAFTSRHLVPQAWLGLSSSPLWTKKLDKIKLGPQGPRGTVVNELIQTSRSNTAQNRGGIWQLTKGPAWMRSQSLYLEPVQASPSPPRTPPSHVLAT